MKIFALKVPEKLQRNTVQYAFKENAKQDTVSRLCNEIEEQSR